MLPIIQSIENEIERQAINEIFETHFPKMQAIAYDILKNHQDAEDIAMGIIQYMCEHPDLFIDYKSPKTIHFVFICTRNAAIDLYRKNQRKSDFFQDFSEASTSLYNTEDSLNNILISNENKDFLVRSIDLLDDIYKTPILLKYTHQMKNIDIAALLNVDVNTVNSRIFRAKQLLREKMKELGYVE
jgi:RNA polymerase sigma-70 factor (ECF subfamily)